MGNKLERNWKDLVESLSETLRQTWLVSYPCGGADGENLAREPVADVQVADATWNTTTCV